MWKKLSVAHFEVISQYLLQEGNTTKKVRSGWTAEIGTQNLQDIKQICYRI
jgi:hypothetical protein